MSFANNSIDRDGDIIMANTGNAQDNNLPFQRVLFSGQKQEVGILSKPNLAPEPGQQAAKPLPFKIPGFF